MESNLATLVPRNLSGLLEETFAIYWRHRLRLICLVALVQVPVSLMSLVIVSQFGNGEWLIVNILILKLVAVVFASGAGAYAVGQQYVTGMISISDCYGRTWWRVKSLGVISLILALATLFFLMMPTFTPEGVLALLVLAAQLPAMVFAVYWAFAVQVVVVEGRHAGNALQRSYSLVRGSWWRVFGIALMMFLVGTGLGIVLVLPFVAVAILGGVDVSSGLATFINVLATLLVEVVVPPVVVIGGTLLYYDLRVRKEDYDLSSLSHEMGIIKA